MRTRRNTHGLHYYLVIYMIPSIHTPTSSNAISITNFDLTSLYLLRPEINVILHTAEQHLSEFNDDSDQAPLLLDSRAILNQLGSVLDLISLHGSSDLAFALSDGMQHLYDKADTGDERLILSLAQGIMTLSRYIEFVLLQEAVEPSLLIDVINELHVLIDKSPINALSINNFDDDNYHYVSVANPAQNFQSVDSLGLDSNLLVTAYRAGLAVILSASNTNLTDHECKKITAMSSACALVATKSKTIFWTAAAAVTQEVSKLLPLNEAEKSLYIFIDQQFQNYLSADDRRCAELVSFACQQDNDWAKALKLQLKTNHLSEKQLVELKRFLQGPDQQISSTLNDFIQQEIEDIKTEIDVSVNHTLPAERPFETINFQPIALKVSALASSLKLLNLNEAALALQHSVEEIKSWLAPGPTELDQLLNTLMIAENAAITLAKSHTPTAQFQRLNNNQLSIHQLDTAYINLIEQSRLLIRELESTISDFVDRLPASESKQTTAFETLEISHDSLNKILNLIRQIAGALRFLELTDAANTLNRLGIKLNESLKLSEADGLSASRFECIIFSNVADILLATDHQLSCQQLGHPAIKQAVYTANRSLSNLLRH